MFKSEKKFWPDDGLIVYSPQQRFLLFYLGGDFHINLYRTCRFSVYHFSA